MPERTIPLTGEPLYKRREEKALALAKPAREFEAVRARLEKTYAAQAQQAPKWGTPAAKRMEIERVQREIAARNNKE